jgi:fluoride exporter
MARVPSDVAWWRVLALIAAGGVAGATCRHLLSRALDDGALPWGTLLANVAGSAALGVVVGLAARHPREPWWYPLVGVGALGALTTMSSFQVEVVLLVDDGRALAAGAYVVLSVVLGLVAAWCGTRSVRRPRRTA